MQEQTARALDEQHNALEKMRRKKCQKCGLAVSNCICAAEIQEAKRKRQPTKIENCAVPVIRVEQKSEESEDEENESSDEYSSSSSSVLSTKPATSKLDVNNPRFLLNNNVWPQLVKAASDLELSNALRSYYADVQQREPHELKCMVDILTSLAQALRVLQEAPPEKPIVSAIGRAIGRLEFYRSKVVVGNAGAAALETALLDERLPKHLRKARHAARKAQKKEDPAKQQKSKDKKNKNF